MGMMTRARAALAAWRQPQAEQGGAQASAGALTDTSGMTFVNLLGGAIAMAVLNGTKRSPAGPTQEVAWNYVNGGGASTASITCPANGVIVGFAVAGFDNPTFNAGTTVVGRSGSVYVLMRTTSGPIGFTNGGGFGGIIATAYEKSQ